MTDKKLDIFDLLKNISTKNVEHFSSLSDEEVKAFVPFVVARWLSGTSDPFQIVSLNEYVNPVAFDLGTKHKRLMYDLMTICSPGKSRKYSWSKLPGKRSSSCPVSIEAIQQYYGYNSGDAAEALQLLNCATVTEIAQDLGFQVDQIKKIKKELTDN